MRYLLRALGGSVSIRGQYEVTVHVEVATAIQVQSIELFT
jgi:hypothetical protein